MAILKPQNLRKVAAFALLTALLWLAPPAYAQDEPSQPLQLYGEKIKAGLIYNFLKYTNWPPDAVAQSNGALHVCLLGEGDFDSYLSPMQGRTAQQYVIQITHIASPAEATSCSMVYVHQSESEMLPQLLQSIKGRHVLTVSDIDQFAEQGGMVEFGTQDQQIGLLINLRAVRAAGLNIQDRLIKLAKLVTDRNG